MNVNDMWCMRDEYEKVERKLCMHGRDEQERWSNENNQNNERKRLNGH